MQFVLALAFSDPAQHVALAAAAESHGWDAITLSDHVVHPARLDSPYPYTPDGSIRWQETTPWPDPWVAIGAMAAVTERIRFLTSVYVLPARNPFVVAKAVGTAAVLSRDRVALGIGVGWMKEEFELLGQDFHDRGRRTDEMIQVLRKLWTGEQVEHHGPCYDFGPLRMLPAPARPIPIYVGGLSEPALRRAARLGEGWISDLHSTREIAEIVARLRVLRAECGRGDEPLTIVAALNDAIDADGFRRAEQAGVTHAMMVPWLLYGGAPQSLEVKRDALRRFADQVIAKLRPGSP